MICADCGIEIQEMDWQLEDGRTVCQSCCVADMQIVFGKPFAIPCRVNKKSVEIPPEYLQLIR